MLDKQYYWLQSLLKAKKTCKYWFISYSLRVSTWRRRLSFHNAILGLFFWVHYFLIDKFCNKVISVTKISFLLNPKKKSLITNNNILMGLSQLQIKWNFLLFYFYVLSCVQLLATPWTVACQAPLSMEFSRQEYLKWIAISSSKESFQPRNWTWVPCIGRWIPYHWAT